ncbi:MAG: hypothetical protein Q9187_002820 [Circinaria calcarea]
MNVSAIRLLRSLTSRIHPPLPLNPRESQQLLSLLNASFRQQLDREHPTDSSNQTGVTDTHFQSILSSPLFTNPRVRPQASANLKSFHPGDSFEEAEHLVSNSIEHFRQQVAGGAANLKIAKECLHESMNNWTTLQQDSTNKTHGPPKICGPILHWLWSRGSYQSLDFLEDRRFVALLTPFLVLEGRKQVIWQWLETLNDTIRYLPVGGEKVPAQVLTQAALIRLYIVTIIRHGGGFGEALHEFLSIVNRVSTVAYPNSSWIATVLTPAGMSLAFIFTEEFRRSNCDADQYNAFLDSMNVWGYSDQISCFNASLRLHHPLNPDAAPSLRYLRAKSVKTLEKSGPYPRKRIMLLCLDTAQTLLSNGHETDAIWVLGFLQDNFAKEIGCGHPPPATNALGESKGTVNETPEAMNLRQLEQLAVH